MAMDSKRAAEVLLKNKDVRVLRAHSVEVEDATDLGAQALEAWAWVERNYAQVSRQHGQWFCSVGLGVYAWGETPLAAVLDAMEKEKGS